MPYAVYRIFYFVRCALWVASWALMLYLLMGWFAKPNNRLRVILSAIFDPLLQPLRALQVRLLGNRLPIDLSPLLGFFAIQLLDTLVRGFYDLIRW